MINGAVFGSLSPLWDAGLVTSSARRQVQLPKVQPKVMASFFFMQPNEQHEWNQADLSWLKAWTVNLVLFFKKAPHLVGRWVPADELSSAISGCRCHLQGLSVATRRFPILAKELPSSCRHPREEDPDAAASVVKQQDVQYLYPITVGWILLLYFCCWWLFWKASFYLYACV